ARGLRLCAYPDADQEPQDRGRGASRAPDGRALDAAAVDRQSFWRAADLRLRVLAARPVRGLDRSAVLCARRQQPAAAGLVRSIRPSGGTRPVFPVCFLEYRQFPGAVVLSTAAGAAAAASDAEPCVDVGLRPSDPPDR